MSGLLVCVIGLFVVIVVAVRVFVLVNKTKMDNKQKSKNAMTYFMRMTDTNIRQSPFEGGIYMMLTG
jgi:hypothetical protein